MRVLLTLILGLSLPLFSSAGDDSNWEPMEATYSVPVPQELEPFAEFPLPDMQVRNKDGRRQFSYTLPVELTGVPQKVVVTEGIENDVGDAVCENASCHVRYEDLIFDEEKVRAHFANTAVDRQELQSRMLVFSSFRRDPEGIIHFIPSDAHHPLSY